MFINCLRYGLACSKWSIKIINDVTSTCSNHNNDTAAAMNVSDQTLNYRILFGTPVGSSTNPLYLWGSPSGHHMQPSVKVFFILSRVLSVGENSIPVPDRLTTASPIKSGEKASTKIKQRTSTRGFKYSWIQRLQQRIIFLHLNRFLFWFYFQHLQGRELSARRPYILSEVPVHWKRGCLFWDAPEESCLSQVRIPELIPDTVGEN